VIIVVRESGEERMIVLKRVMVWVVFSKTAWLTILMNEARSVLGGGNLVRRDVVSESAGEVTFEYGSIEESTVIFSFENDIESWSNAVNGIMTIKVATPMKH
jgi:hypothetical protein